jgi:hypothetical protein
MSVTPANIAVALGRTAPTDPSVEFDQWSMWIADALLLIESRLGDPAELDQAKLDYVVREAVVAHVRNPDSATQVSVSVDDASSSRTYRSSAGRISILDAWWDLLSPTHTKGKAFEVDTMPASAGVYGVDYWWSGPDTWVSF